nr:Gfo/Idh/MocA family oxidoreductase [Hartmannibacter diazotrophicus]
MDSPIPLAIVGVGKIARDQHLPSISRTPAFALRAAVSRNAEVDGVQNFTDIEACLAARPDVKAVALCLPPEPRFAAAITALEAGCHVLLEKPPGATLGETDVLADLAREKGVTIFATWHSRFAPAVQPAKAFLADRAIRKVTITWREDVRRWHPGQGWVWEPAGFGVFDPGINALSILTEILPDEALLRAARLEVPENAATPIGVTMTMGIAGGGYEIDADFDWRQEGPQTWEIAAETDGGLMSLTGGGKTMAVDGKVVSDEPEAEYDGIYKRFADLIEAGESDMDMRPLRLVADACLLGRRVAVEPFHE